MCTRRGYEAGLVPGHQQHGRDGQGSDLVLRQPLGYRIRAARYQGPALWHGDGQHAGEFARTPRPVVAAQRLRGGAVDLAGRGWRGAWLRPAAEIQYRQTPHAFIVPPGLHAVRPDPKHAGKPLAPVDGNLHRHAGCSAPVQEGIWSDLKYEGSLEASPYRTAPKGPPSSLAQHDARASS